MFFIFCLLFNPVPGFPVYEALFNYITLISTGKILSSKRYFVCNPGSFVREVNQVITKYCKTI